MILLRIDEVFLPECTMNRHMHRCVIERNGKVVGRLHTRKRECLRPVVQHTLRVMGYTGNPEPITEDTWMIVEPGDG